MNSINSNEPLRTRINGIFNLLKSSFEAGAEMSSATKGTERELFIAALLSQVFPSHYRFSSGDITASSGNRSGQIDIVLEFPRGFSFPFHPEGPRLFLAEGVAAAIEVKSNLIDQWDEVLATGNKLRQVERRFAPDFYEQIAVQIENGELSCHVDDPKALIAKLRAQGVVVQNRAETRIPLFAVGFDGWKSEETLTEKLQCDVVDSIFVIKSELYASKIGPAFARGPYSMLLFLEHLEQELLKTTVTLPTLYNYRPEIK